MVAAGPKISVAVEPPTAFIKIAGRAAVESSRDFKDLIQKLSARGVDHFVLDLRGCLLMDSTFSGVLAGLIASPPASLDPPVKSRFTLVQPNERVADLMDNLGVLALVQRVDISEVALPDTLAEEFPTGQHTQLEVAACCLEAHQILMALKPENVAKFRALEQVLIAQLGDAPSARDTSSR